MARPYDARRVTRLLLQAADDALMDAKKQGPGGLSLFHAG